MDISSTLSNTGSKQTVLEESSITFASLEEAKRRENDAISNERIQKGDLILDTYEVISDAISGGMGSVWRVHHKSWNTDLAMKRPQPKFFAEGSGKRKEQFIAECENWINLGLHPNIVSCYYVREIGGVPSIFSEWMDGGSLKDRIADGSLYEGTDAEIQERILDIAIQAARGLQYSHENGLIHQDMKPGNLLLSKDWDAKVADFGLAKAKEQLDDLSETAKTTGYTLAYCPKEQSDGEEPARWMDVYAWTLTVLEMYAGKRLWEIGAEAKDDIDTYTGQYKIAVPEEMQTLLKSCLTDQRDGFAGVMTQLAAAYQSQTGNSYAREAARAADTADILNNQALSFIDLGLPEKAEQLLAQAIEKDGSFFLYRYNYALLRWNTKKTSDQVFVNYLKLYADESELYKRAMETLRRLRGTLVTGESGEWYYYVDVDSRSEEEEEEPLIPLSKVSADGRYEVEGYAESAPSQKDRYGYRVKDLQTGEVKDYPNEYDDYGESTSLFGNYMHPHYYKRKDVLFAGANSEYIIMEAHVLWIFEAKSGRLLLSVPPIVDVDGDTTDYSVNGYTKSGTIEYVNLDEKRVRRVHLSSNESLPYELAGIATIDARLEAERNMYRYYEEAQAYWEKGDVDGTLRVLNRSLEDQVLTLHEPSLRLWTKLGAYFKRDVLVTVLPTQDEPTPVPPRNKPKHMSHFAITVYNKNHTDNAQTALELSRREKEEFDWCMDMNEYTFYYTLYATDMLSGETYYKVEYLEVACEAEWKQFSKDRYLGLKSDSQLWYGQEYEETRLIDLAKRSRDGKGSVRFALPGNYWLSNTKEGVDIGGFVFDDLFTDFRPLWNADIIACRDHNYRLVYRYLADERIEPDTAADSESGDPDEDISVSRSDSSDDSTSAGCYFGKSEAGAVKDDEFPQELLEEYELISGPVRGAEVNVWYVREKTDGGRHFAVKRPHSRFLMKDRSLILFMKKMDVWHWLNSEAKVYSHVVTYNRCRTIHDIPCLFFPWMDGGSLRDRIKDGSLYQGAAEEVQERLLKIASDTAEGLRLAHRFKVIHLDVKPANILLTADWSAELSDFGYRLNVLEREYDEAKRKGALLKTVFYTPAYSPAQQQNGEKPELWMDVYAWALTMLEMYLHKRPWSSGSDVPEHFDAYCADCRDFPDGMKALLKDCVMKQTDNFVEVEERLQQIQSGKGGTKKTGSREKNKEKDKGFFARLFGKKD